MTGGWRAIRRCGDRSPQVRTLAGPSIPLLGLTTWIALLWLGWTLVFVGGLGLVTFSHVAQATGAHRGDV